MIQCQRYNQIVVKRSTVAAGQSWLSVRIFRARHVPSSQGRPKARPYTVEELGSGGAPPMLWGMDGGEDEDGVVI
ncbi:hypothetical protein Ddc_15178 [Ditylenchus destructor]|nr:hypothetical protein Ddc_15178 [Ditylenchus destructor]